MNNGNLSRFIAVAEGYGLVPVIPVAMDSLGNASLIDQWHREKGTPTFALREPRVGGSVVDVLLRSDVPYDGLMTNAMAGELLGRKV